MVLAQPSRLLSLTHAHAHTYTYTHTYTHIHTHSHKHTRTNTLTHSPSSVRAEVVQRTAGHPTFPLGPWQERFNPLDLNLKCPCGAAEILTVNISVFCCYVLIVAITRAAAAVSSYLCPSFFLPPRLALCSAFSNTNAHTHTHTHTNSLSLSASFWSVLF